MESVPFYKKARFWRIIIPLSLFIWYLIAFKQETALAIQGFLTLFKNYGNVAANQPLQPLNWETVLAMALILGGVGIYAICFHAFALLTSQFVLPAQNAYERWKIFERLLSYLNHWHGPAVLIKEGKPVARSEELQSFLPGVARVDLSSALVLEKQWGHFGISLTESSSKEEPAIKPPAQGTRFAGVPGARAQPKSVFNLLQRRKSGSAPSIVRVVGPGIVFTEYGEKVRGTADLRPQLRQSDTEILGNTRDGIQISTTLFAFFTLGQPADVVRVALVGNKPDDLRVIHIEQREPETEEEALSEERSASTFPRIHVIQDLCDELDADDKEEIFRSIRSKPGPSSSAHAAKAKSEPAAPFAFDPQRVFSAVYSRARDSKAGNLGDWTDLPVLVTKEVFLNLLAQYTFDQLFLPEDPNEFPLSNFRDRLSKSVRNRGLLSYQFVRRQDNKPFHVGDLWDEAAVEFHPEQPLRRLKELRRGGIKILAAGFRQLAPTDETVRKQMLHNWQARWQKDADSILADSEMQALQIRNSARVKAARAMVRNLSQILKATQYTQEALALRVYQALEVAATDPATRRLLPSDTINMLWTLRQWLLPRDGNDEPHPGKRAPTS